MTEGPSVTPVAAIRMVPELRSAAQQDQRPAAPPGFVWSARVFFDELDSAGMLHNARYPVLTERASSAFFEANGWRWQRDPAANPDQYYVVSEQTIRYLLPIAGPSDIVVEMWVTRLGRTSVSLAFEIRSPQGSPVYAQAERVHVKLDPATARPTPWTPRLREHLATLLRPTGPPGAGQLVAGPVRHGSQA